MRSWNGSRRRHKTWDDKILVAFRPCNAFLLPRQKYSRSFMHHPSLYSQAISLRSAHSEQEEVLWPWDWPSKTISGGLDRLKRRLFLWHTLCQDSHFQDRHDLRQVGKPAAPSTLLTRRCGRLGCIDQIFSLCRNSVSQRHLPLRITVGSLKIVGMHEYSRDRRCGIGGL